MNSRIFTGQVMHARRWPKKHYFSYRIYLYAFDLDELEMLMREAPGTVNQDVPLTRTAALKDVLGEAIDALPPQERFIAEQLFIAGSSLRKTGAALGIPKTTLARRRDTIRRHLMAELVDKPSVRRWLRGD